MIAKCVLEVEIAMGAAPVPIYVSRTHFALRYEVPKFLARGGHLCMAMLLTALPPDDGASRDGPLIVRSGDSTALARGQRETAGQSCLWET